MPFNSDDVWWQIAIPEGVLSQVDPEQQTVVGDFISGFWEPTPTLHCGKHWFQKEHEESADGTSHNKRVSDMGAVTAVVYSCS